MNVTIVPNLRTAGGEICDIMIDDQYGGTMSLVYREYDRISGSVQLDQDCLSPSEKEEAEMRVREYVQSLIDAIEAEECSIVVTYSRLDHVIASPDRSELESDEDWEYDDVDTETQLGDIEDGEREELQMAEDEDSDFDLIVIDEKDGRVEYHIVDQGANLIAEAIAVINDRDVHADIVWERLPSDHQMMEATDLIVSDFDEDEIETFQLDMKYKDRLIETVQLAHNRLLKDNWSGMNEKQADQEYH